MSHCDAASIGNDQKGKEVNVSHPYVDHVLLVNGSEGAAMTTRRDRYDNNNVKIVIRRLDTVFFDIN